MRLFYIQDTRQVVGNCVLWWGPDRAGYTTELDKAGLYEEDEARSIERLRGTDKAWPKDQIDKVAVRHVRGEHLKEDLHVAR